MDPVTTAQTTSPGGRCPTCGKPRVSRWRPFCSKRCADVDLGRWFGESYRIRVVDIDEDDEGMPNDTDHPS